MLKKTAAMAVLVLMIASLFSGSLGPVQAGDPAKIGVPEFTHEYTQGFPWTTLSAMHVGRVVSSGTFGTGGAMATDRPESPGAHVEFAGIPAGAGMVVTGQVSSDGSERAYSTIIVYMNDSEIKIPAPGFGMFPDKNGTARVFSHRMSATAFEPGALSFDGKIAMFKAGSAVPDWFDLRWENMQAVRFGEKMSPAIFSAHLVIPPVNGSEEMPLPPWPFPGEYVFDSNVTVDLANLTNPDGITLRDSLYNNEIAAGETQWHSADISDAVESVNVDLKWRDSGHPLKLTIYTPDGHVLGPYDDSSDGKTDSRINLNVDNPSGVAAGEWSLKVTDTGVAGKDAYYVKTY